MSEPLIASGLVIQARTHGPPAGSWASIGQVLSITGSEFSVPFSEITGKADLWVQRVPGRMSPGTITFKLLMNAENPAGYLAWKQAAVFHPTYDLRVNCGPASPANYVINFSKCWLGSVTIPQPDGDIFSYSITFQLSE